MPFSERFIEYFGVQDPSKIRACLTRLSDEEGQSIFQERSPPPYFWD